MKNNSERNRKTALARIACTYSRTRTIETEGATESRHRKAKKIERQKQKKISEKHIQNKPRKALENEKQKQKQ